jgi:hypothetical protein
MYKKVFVLVILASFLVAPASYVKADLTKGLVGYWPLDGNAEDLSGNGNHGMIEGNVTPTTDRFGTPDSAMNFPGNTSDYIDLGQPPMLLIKGAMTVAAWVRADTMMQNGRILAKQGPSSARSWSIQIESAGGYARFDVGINPTDRIRADSEPLTFEPDEWWHIAGVFRPAEAAELYINGELVKSEPTTVDTQWIENNLSVNIGRRPQPGTPWQGDIDEVYMYDIALTPAEIISLMNGKLLSFPKARGPSPKDGALLTDIWANLSWSPGDYAVSHDVYVGDNFDDVNSGAEGTFVGNQEGTFIVVGFPGFPYPDGLVPGTTYYWRIDEVNDTEPNSPWKGDIWSFSVPPKTAYFPNPADSAEAVSLDAQLSWTGGFGSKLHTVYFGDNFDEVENATGGQTQGTTTFTPGTLKMAKTYYWRVDEFDIVETHKGNVWSFITEGGVAAIDPANGAVDVTQTPVLTWAPGLGASHEIYFGTDAASLELKSSGNLGSESYEPGQLEWNTTYYWLVDEANNANTDSPWTGPLWSFTTANFLIIDDMEAYNDINEGEEGSNRIYLAWADGYDNPAVNGSVVGNDPPPIAEQTIVHSGNQSMPMAYDNAVGKSEATLTLTDKRDWTVNGVDTLTIWFRGDSGNAAEQMYVALNGSARVDHDNPNAAMSTSWTEWNIPLQAFADQGLNLANVNSITLGLSSVTGGTGKMYFDDIRLYPPAP